MSSSLRLLLPLLALLSAATCCSYFDSYNGAKLSDQQLKKYESNADTAQYCVNKIIACDKKEGRRIDGSCNNLATPTAGSGHARYLRLVKPRFAKNKNGYAVRQAKDGSPLPNARKVRTQVLSEGRVPGQVFTQLMSHFFILGVTDFAGISIHDTFNYVFIHTCCPDEGAAADPLCAPISVDPEDPVHRFSGVRCLNMTWPISFQNTGCRSSNSAPERMYFGTPFFDLSAMYGNGDSTAAQQRNGTGGLLGYELTDSGYQWPVVNTDIPTNLTYDGIIGLVGPNYIFGLIFWREHNRIAAELAKINPCWSDDKLFNITRDINIATYQQIMYYELLAPLLGKKNLQKMGVLPKDEGFHDVYDEKVLPAMIIDSLASMRWIHTTVDGTLYFYDANGTKTEEYIVQKLALNTAALKSGQANIKYVAQGGFRQPAAEADAIIDPVMSEWVMGKNQFTADVATDDLAKARMMGLAPYVDYVKYCDGKKISHWKDLKAYMTEERIEVLQEMYSSVEDIDMPTGLWSESLKKGTNVPPTFYCLFSKQILRTVVSDRHWYERSKRPNAFTAAQLKEIRKTTVSRVMCDNADSVVEITPKAFEVISEKNKLTPCKKLKHVDLTKWADKTCKSS